MTEFCTFGERECCEDGTWTCLNGGKYICGGLETSSPNGKVCDDDDEDEEVVVVNQAACIMEVKTCADGTLLTPDPNNGCEYPPCPSTAPSCGTGVAACCEDGTFACPTIDDGLELYICSGQVLLERPAGTNCVGSTQSSVAEATTQAVEAATQTRLEVPTTQAASQEAPTTQAPPTTTQAPETTTTTEEPCCDLNSSHSCLVGPRKCCNGEWICAFNAQGNFFRCNGVVTPNPSGTICEVDQATGSQVSSEAPIEVATTKETIVTTTTAVPAEATSPQTTQETPQETTAAAVESSEPHDCPTITKKCPNGEVVTCNPNDGCRFFPCKGASKAAKKAKKRGRGMRNKRQKAIRKRRKRHYRKQAKRAKKKAAAKKRSSRKRVRGSGG